MGADYKLEISGDHIVVKTNGRDNLKQYFCESLLKVYRNRKWGFVDDNGTTIIPFNYDMVDDFLKDRSIVKIYDKFGCINKKNEMIIPCIYDELKITKADKIIARKNKKYGMLDLDGIEIVNFDNDQIWEYQDYIYFHKSPEYGIINKHNKKVIINKNSNDEIIINYIHSFHSLDEDRSFKYKPKFSNGYCIFEISCRYFDDINKERIAEEVYNVINENGDTSFTLIERNMFFSNDIVVHFINSSMLCLSYYGCWHGDGYSECYAEYYIFKRDKGGVYKAYKRNRDETHKSKYDRDIFLCDNYELIGINDDRGGSGFIDYDGNIKIPLEYEEVYSFRDGIALVKKDKKCGFINLSNEIVFPFDYDDARYMVNGLIPVAKEIDGKLKWGCIDDKNNVKIPLMYDDIEEIKKDYIVVKNDGTNKIIDYENNQILSEYAVDFARNEILITKYDMKELYVNIPSGKIMKEQYIANEVNLQAYYEFHDGLAMVIYNNKCGYVDKNSKIIIPFMYNAASNFKNGIAITKLRDNYGAINTKNIVVTPHIYKDPALKVVDKVILKFDFVERNQTYISVKKDGKWGLLDKNENEILKPMFYEKIGLVKVLSDEYVKIILDGRETIVDRNGKIIS